MAPPCFVSSMLNKFGTNWSVYNFYLLRARHFGHLFREKVGIAASFTDSLKKMARTEDKISAAYRYVQKNVEWNGEQVFYFNSVEECLKTKTPSSAEMNFLLLNLLRMAGVSCYPLLVSTHENGNPDESFSILSQFNGLDLIVYDSLLFYDVDCTQKDLSFKIPPYNILNTYAYLVDFDKYGWIFITDNRISMIKETSIQAEMDSQGGIKGLSQSRMIGYAKSSEMEKIRNQGKSKDRSAPGENMTDLVMDSVSYIHNLDDNDTLIGKMSFRFKPSNTDKIYFINPLLFAVQEENPFRDSIRLSDIDFGVKQSYRVNVELKLPDNFPPPVCLQISCWKNRIPPSGLKEK